MAQQPETNSARLVAVEAIVARYEGELLRYANRLLNNREAAQDVVQDAFIRLYRTWQDELKEGPALQTWLYRVTHNCAVDLMRREQRREALHLRHAREHEEDLEPPRHGFEPAISEEADQAAQALKTLSLREQELVVLKVYEEKSYKEISEITGLSVSNVGYILHNAMKKLAAAMPTQSRP